MDRLRAMELFLSVSHTKSFSETARHFGISATAVSRMIADIEETLKVKLLLRSTRQIMLTESGMEYARHLESILSSIHEAHTNITAIRQAPKGTLRVHSRTMFGVRVLPLLISRFRSQYPDIKIELTLSETPADLRQGLIDMDFRITPPVEAGVKRRILFKIERYLVASPEYLLSHPAPEVPLDLLKHNCLAYMLPGVSYTWNFRKADHFEEQTFTPHQLTNNGLALLELARLGEGIALLDDYIVHRDLARGTLVHVLPEYQANNTSMEAGMYATISDTSLIPAKIQLFMDFVAAQLSGEGNRFDILENDLSRLVRQPNEG
ncbi:LysR substrate-binding domain-containing protein [Limnohabitans sp.]|jgi:DNA-binding transcriptional LysR family regulator|uniref:LysR family transcriptional regulator n=1 Tax=Limnohabitans sp. TaxID=1907725 RepID=UPI0037C178EE